MKREITLDYKCGKTVKEIALNFKLAYSNKVRVKKATGFKAIIILEIASPRIIV